VYTNEERKAKIKEIISRVHEGEDPEKLKAAFKEILGDVRPEEISRIEEEMIKEGLPPSEIQKLCEVHMAMFREALEAEETIAPEGHPIRILMEEHRLFLQKAIDLQCIARANKKNPNLVQIQKDLSTIQEITHHFKAAESHYLREENILFPFLEKHEIKQPPAIMWMEHDQIRGIKKEIYKLVDQPIPADLSQYSNRLEELTTALVANLSSHFYKENNILYPSGLEVITASEWQDIREQFDELGYSSYTPKAPLPALSDAPSDSISEQSEGAIQFETGQLTREELENFINGLPIDVTFVDATDSVRFFNQPEHRVFPRTKAVIGRKVENCHPQKSVHVVRKILESFHEGTKDKAEFWITLNGAFLHIRYFAIRNAEGTYLGCAEMMQDITDIRALKGQRSLLNWE
jgi:hypothetical protein